MLNKLSNFCRVLWLARKAALAWAVKFCQDETSAALLKRESKTLNEIQQKLPAGTAHIAALLDFQLDEMPYWLAFEYVEGGTLESRIRLGPMDWPTAWSLFEPILQGMAMVHELNIVHRDLKPANILLDKNLKPRIADFGIGKLMATQVATTQRSQRSRSMTTRGYGSLGYMSPEQAKGDPAHPADDVYALGVILWQMLQGTVQQFPEFPDDIADLAVADTVKQALSRCRFSRRDKRPQTARELLELLARSELVERRNSISLELSSTSSDSSGLISKALNYLGVKSQQQSQTQFQSQSQSQSSMQSKRQAFEPEMILIKAGKFKMGSNENDREKPIHEVTIARDFWLGKYAILFGEYDAFCVATYRDKPKDEGWGRGRRPVINVTWNDAVAYCEWLSEQTGKNYRLPTEAEWEYACRAGTTTKYSFGDDANKLDDYAWFEANSDRKTHPVGEKKPNPWGLYDMHGNVCEWCQDEHLSDYSGAPTDGSPWETDIFDLHTMRGGSWYDEPDDCRSAYRNFVILRNWSYDLGFRVAVAL